MQQIKFDSLLTLSAAPQNAVHVKLDPGQFYPARLHIDQHAQLQIQAGNGQLQVLLSAAQVQQILQSSNPARVSSGSYPIDSVATTGRPIDSRPADSQQPGSPANQAGTGTQAPGATDIAGTTLKLLVRLQPTTSGDVLLTVQSFNKTLQLPLSNTQLLDMLRQPPIAAGQTFSTTALQLNGMQAAVLMRVSKVAEQLLIQPEGGTGFKLPLQQVQGAQSWPEGKTMLAQLMTTASGQLTLSPVQPDGDDNPVAGHPSSMRPITNAQGTTPPAQPPALLLSNKAAQQLLPMLAQQIWPERLSSQPQPWLQNNLPALRSATSDTAHIAGVAANAQQPLVDLITQQKPPLRWQLSHHASQFLLQLQPDTPALQLRLSQTEFTRPFHFNGPLPTPQPVQPDISKDLWRQLLPLSPLQADPLADSPELPPAVRQLLQWVRQSQPDGKQMLDSPQIQQQLTAAMQFQPLVASANNNTAAGTIALAISMLLGRLAATSHSDKMPAAGKERLAQLIGQLDNQQSSQLLKQLAGHSGQLQAAQIATLEQPAARLTEQPLFIQLPLQYDAQSRMAELCITEQDSQDGAAGQRQRQWQLTMKFNLGHAGELLAKVTLKQQQISLQFYTDQAATIQVAEKFLPLLKDRLKVQGIDVTDAGCQLGRIPEHLYRQGTSLLQVRV